MRESAFNCNCVLRRYWIRRKERDNEKGFNVLSSHECLRYSIIRTFSISFILVYTKLWLCVCMNMTSQFTPLSFSAFLPLFRHLSNFPKLHFILLRFTTELDPIKTHCHLVNEWQGFETIFSNSHRDSMICHKICSVPLIIFSLDPVFYLSSCSTSENYKEFSVHKWNSIVHSL